MSTLCPDARAALPLIEMAAKAETPRILNIDIPTELASVDEWYQAPGKPNPKLIVHIQDAHANYEAQTHIRDVIKHLNVNYGFKTILVEGAASELDPSILKLFPDQERNLKLVDELAKIGEVTGAEMFLAENSDAAKGVGIEKPDLYRRNFDALQKVYSEDEFVSAYFEAYENKLGQIASRSFGPRMIQALAEWRKFENGHRDFLPFVSALAELSKKALEIDLGVLYSQIEWPQLTRLLVLQRLEKELVPEAGGPRPKANAIQSAGRRSLVSGLTLKEQALAEKQQIMDLLEAAKVSDGLIQALERFDEKTANLNRIGSSEVYQASAPRALMETLVEEGGKVGFNIREYPAFAKYAGYLILRSEIVPGELFEEIKRLFDLILESLVKDAPSAAMEKSDDLASRKRLLLLHRDEMLARKLLKLELTHNEWLAVLKRQDRFYPEDLNRRMLEQLGQNTRLQSVSEEESAQMKRLNESFRASFTFYSAAVNRDTFFFQRIQEVLKQEDKAILVTGGFHAEGMKYLFRKYDINYGTLTPRITQNFSNDLYRKVMMTGAAEEQVESGNGTRESKNKNAKENYLVPVPITEPAAAGFDGKYRFSLRWDAVLKIANLLGFRAPVKAFDRATDQPSDQAWIDVISQFEVEFIRPSFFSRWVKLLLFALGFGFIALPSLFAQQDAAAAYLKDAVDGKVQMILATNNLSAWERVASYLKANGFQGEIDAKATGEMMNRLFNQAIQELSLEGQPLTGETMNRIAAHMLKLAIEEGGKPAKLNQVQGASQDFLALLIAAQFNIRSLSDLSTDEVSRLSRSFGVSEDEIRNALQVLKTKSGDVLFASVKGYVQGQLQGLARLEPKQAREIFLRDVLDPALALMELRGKEVFDSSMIDLIAKSYAELFSGEASEIIAVFASFSIGSADSKLAARVNQRLKSFGYQFQFNFNGTVFYRVKASRPVRLGGVGEALLLSLFSRDLLPAAHGLSVVGGEDVYLLEGSFEQEGGDLKLSLIGQRIIQRLLQVDSEDFKRTIKNLRERDFSEKTPEEIKLIQQDVTAVHEIAHKHTEMQGAAIGQLSLLLEADAYIKSVGHSSAPNYALAQWVMYLLNAYGTTQPGSDVADYLGEEINAAWEAAVAMSRLTNEDDAKNVAKEYAQKRHRILNEMILKLGGKVFPSPESFEPISDAYSNNPWAPQKRSEARVVTVDVSDSQDFLATTQGKQAAVGAGLVSAGLLVFLGVSLLPFALPAIIPYGVAVISFASVAYALYHGLPALDRVRKASKDGVVFAEGPIGSARVAPSRVKEVQTSGVEQAAEEPNTFSSVLTALEAERARDNPDVARLVGLTVKLVDLAGDIDEAKKAQSLIRDLRVRHKNDFADAQSINLIMKVAQLAVKLNQFQRAQNVDVHPEVEVVAQAPREAIFASLSDKERANLKLMTYQNLEEQISDAQNLSASQAVAILIAYGFISENEQDAAKNMARLASLAVAKVATEQTSELSEMLRAFYPEAFSDAASDLIYVIDLKNWTPEQAELTKLYLILNPNLKVRIVVALKAGEIFERDNVKKLFGNNFKHRLVIESSPEKTISPHVNSLLLANKNAILTASEKLGVNGILAKKFVTINYDGFEFEHRAAALKTVISFSQAADQQVPDGMEKAGTSFFISKGTLAKLIESIQRDILGMFEVMQSA
ncbi:MAG TPA: hypothetical protein PLY88_01195 [Candidatus Omnitrophota bacterium]|nr:hypothetical protein [Candidatus Omnitrophota bacterium]